MAGSVVSTMSNLNSMFLTDVHAARKTKKDDSDDADADETPSKTVKAEVDEDGDDLADAPGEDEDIFN